jgi:arylsulfatase A-like enzyme
MCARVDHQFGMILKALQQSGVSDDTAVFFFADHGDFTGDYGLVEKTQNTFEDCLTRVPLLIRTPKGAGCEPGIRDALVELIDFPATVHDLLGLEVDYTHFGRSLLPLLAGETEEHRNAVFCEGGRLPGEVQAMEWESMDKWEGKTSPYWPRLDLQTSDEGPWHTKAAMCRTKTHKYVRRLLEEDELYDLEKDPGELSNVVGDPAYGEVFLALKDRMLTWYMETCDAVPYDTDRRW